MNERLKELRKCLGVNQEEFSTKIGVTRSAISRLESVGHLMLIVHGLLRA